MKPHRIRMTHNLILNYGLYRKMKIYVRALPNLVHRDLLLHSLSSVTFSESAQFI